MSDAVPREVAAHHGIDGTWHHYGALDWWPQDRWQDYDHPICPVTQLAYTDEKAECRTICQRVTDEDGRGAWYCGLHGVFRVFEYPRDRPETEQTTLTGVSA